MLLRRTTPGPFAVAFGWSALLVWVLWVADWFWHPPSFAEDALSSLFLLYLVCLPLAPLLGLYFRVVVGPANPYGVFGSFLRKRARAAWTPDDRAGFLFLTRWTSLGLWAVTTLYLSAKLGTKIGYDVVRPNYQAILTLAGSLAIALALAPLCLFLIRGGERMAHRLASLRGVRWIWTRQVVVLGVVALGAAAVVTLFAVKQWEAIRLSPWEKPALIATSLLLATLLAWPLSHLLGRRGGSIGFALFLLTSVCVSSVAVGTLDTSDRKARFYFLQTAATRMAYQGAVKLLDSDGDGFMHQFAGGDCNPDEPDISPSALDEPGNGVDEDCDGRDVPLELLERGRFDYPLPESYVYEKPNVVILSVDALAASHVGFMGYERNTTPNLDELAENCVVFDRAFAQGPSTRLSIASLFTSKYDSQMAHGSAATIPYPLLPENLTMAEIFKKNGYDTVAILPHEYFSSRWKGILQGFDTTDTSSFGKKGGGKHNGAKVTEAAEREIKKGRSKPLFLWAHYWDAHPPFSVPKKAKAFGRKEKVDLYDSEVRFVDEKMAPLYDAIDDNLRRRGYILIVTADHGSAFDKAHSRHSHGHDLSTNVLHVPLMICLSSGAQPRTVEETPVSLMDLLPTLVNLGGLDVGKNKFEGTSLVPLVFGQDEEWPERYLFHQYFLTERIRNKKDPLMMVSVRTKSYNYVWQREDDVFELFDYLEDPDETENLLDADPELGQGLNAVMHNWLHRVHSRYRQVVEHESADSAEDTDDDGGAGNDYTDDY